MILILLLVDVMMNRYLTFEKVVALGSFTKAAAALGYTQSAVSQMINALEAEVGVRLITRGRGQITLTAEGKRLYPWIERLVAQYRTLENKVDEVHGLDGGVIRIGTISSVTRQWLPKLIQEFEQQYPNVRFVFHQGDYALNSEWIKTGAVDFGIVTPPAVKNMQTIPLKSEQLLVVLNPNHPAAQLKAVPLTMLAHDPYIMVEQGNYSEPLNAFHAAHITPNLKFTIHDDYAIMTMVEQGLGFSILSELVLNRMPFKIKALPADPPIQMNLALGFKDKDALPLASQRFIDFMAARKRELV